MSRVDRILDAIDVGLQTAGDVAYGHDTEGVCWRCLESVTVAADETCESCRLDLTVGPVHGPPKQWGSTRDEIAAHVAEAQRIINGMIGERWYRQADRARRGWIAERQGNRITLGPGRVFVNGQEVPLRDGAPITFTHVDEAS